jgi:hypothetical protein
VSGQRVVRRNKSVYEEHGKGSGRVRFGTSGPNIEDQGG